MACRCRFLAFFHGVDFHICLTTSHLWMRALPGGEMVETVYFREMGESWLVAPQLLTDKLVTERLAAGSTVSQQSDRGCPPAAGSSQCVFQLSWPRTAAAGRDRRLPVALLLDGSSAPLCSYFSAPRCFLPSFSIHAGQLNAASVAYHCHGQKILGMSPFVLPGQKILGMSPFVLPLGMSPFVLPLISIHAGQLNAASVAYHCHGQKILGMSPFVPFVSLPFRSGGPAMQRHRLVEPGARVDSTASLGISRPPGTFHHCGTALALG